VDSLSRMEIVDALGLRDTDRIHWGDYANPGLRNAQKRTAV